MKQTSQKTSDALKTFESCPSVQSIAHAPLGAMAGLSFSPGGQDSAVSMKTHTQRRVSGDATSPAQTPIPAAAVWDGMNVAPEPQLPTRQQSLLAAIEALRCKAGLVMEELGSICCNLRDADEWAKTEGSDEMTMENAVCALESVAAGAVEAARLLVDVSRDCEAVKEGGAL